MQTELKQTWDKAMKELPPMSCGRIDMASYDGATGEQFRNVYIGGDVTVQIKGPFCDHVAYAAGEYQSLVAERDGLRASLSAATQATTCAVCGIYKHTPIRSDIGYVCAGCLEKERDALNQTVSDLVGKHDTLAAQLASSLERERGLREALKQVVTNCENDFTNPLYSCRTDYQDAIRRTYEMVAKVLTKSEPTTQPAETQAQDGMALIANERLRQVSIEGWTPEHDDEHDIGQLCSAAICYIIAGDCLANGPVLMGVDYRSTPEELRLDFQEGKFGIGVAWPWDWEWLKISPDPVRSLAKAGALIAAEIDRIRRRANASEGLE